MKFNIKQYIRPHFEQIAVYESNRPSVLEESCLYLDANESPVGIYNRYPDAQYRLLREKFAAINKVPADQVFLGCGSDELIDMLIRVFCEPKEDSIIVLDPSFSMYEVYAGFNDVKVEKIALNADFQLEEKVFIEKFSDSKAKILFLCSPNNPTGNSIDNLDFFIENFSGIVVVDEAYIEFSNRQSVVNLLPKFPNLIVLKTLSKAYGMAGLRVGAGFASYEIAKLMNRVKPPYNISSESQRIAMEQLSSNIAEQNIKDILNEKSKLNNALLKLEIVENVFPSDANFFLIKFKDVKLVFQELEKNGIFTSLRHPKIKNCIRVSVGTASQNEKLISILSQISS